MKVWLKAKIMTSQEYKQIFETFVLTDIRFKQVRRLTSLELWNLSHGKPV